MLEESQPRPQTGLDPSMNRHRPASEKTQDISHLLASIFKDLYTTEIIGKDTVAILTKTRRGGNNYHDKYVEDLQQVHSEYSRRMRDADMLENHIIQARIQATATESRAHTKVVEEVGEAYQQLGLPPVRWTFMWCVDNGLLKSNNLICPEDYITGLNPLIKAPRAMSAPGFAKPTVSYNRHICYLPQDDGYTVIPPPERTAQSLLEESETSLTLACSSDTCTPRSLPSQKVCRVRKPKWMYELGAKSRAEERAGLQKLQQRHKFLRNPRFLPPNAHQGGKSLILLWEKGDRGRKGQKQERSPAEPIPVFLANPPVVFFTDYRVGQVFETTVELRNMTATSRHVRVLPPTTPHFSLGLGRFPGEGGIVAPGMSCQYTVLFAPDSLADYQDFLVVETQAQYPLLVPIEARRPPPILTLPSVLDCGYCLVGGVRFRQFLCCNEGLSAGTFCILPRRQWPASNIRSVVTTSFAEEPPFAVSPSLFELQPGQTTVVEVVFFPMLAESCSQVFTIVCDNCQVKDITVQGQGQLIGLELVCVSGEEEVPALGELCDVTAEHYVRFPTANPYSVQQKTLTIRNNTHLELAFHWQIMQPNLQTLLPGEIPDPAHIQYHLANDDVFYVSPASGLLTPLQDHEFLLTYQPQQLMDYHRVCHLVVRDVPELPREDEPLDTAPKVNDVIVMEIEVKGLTQAYQVLLEPYSIHIPGEVFIGTTIRRSFKMWNNSRSRIAFLWERSGDCHIMEVEPPAGEIEMNECFDLELVLTGGRPGAVISRLLCHVQHHHQPVALVIQVTFKGPQVSVSVPSLDLGLMQLGDQTQATMVLTNTTHLEAFWSLGPEKAERTDSLESGKAERTDSLESGKAERTDSLESGKAERTDSLESGKAERTYSHHTQITVQPCKGVLPSLASCSVDILFRPLFCQHFDTVLELAVENGQGCHLSVQADVHSPQVCLLTCDLVFSELYVGVPARGSITLINQTLLPAHYTWTMLQGQQASLCSASFTPSSGTLGPNAKKDVTVAFTAHTDMELSAVAALCEVTGMKDPLVLRFFSTAQRLNVSYSLLRDCPGLDEEDPAVSLVLDFGDNVLLKRPITKQLVITNHTAIPAPFTLEAEYFTGHAPSPPAGQSQQRGLHVRKPLHSVQAKKVEDKAQEGFVSGLLAHGKGAAFFVHPDCGILGAFETQTIDITSFTNMWGEYRDQLICKVGDLQPKLIPIQMTVMGCPLYFQMIGPQPDRQNQGPIIRFGTHVSGGDTVSRSLRLNNTSPYDIRMDWESYNVDQEDRKLLDVVVAYGDAFPLKDADGNEVVGGGAMSNDTPPTWDRSHTPSTEGTSSSLKSMSDLEEEKEEEGSVHSASPQKRLFSVFIRPHEGNASDYPYCITPQQINVPAGGSSTIHVSFTPLTLSELTSNAACVSFALGFMSLDSKVSSCIPGKVQRAQGQDLEPLRLDLQASVRPAVLSVQMEEEEECLEFCAVASDLIQGEPHNEMVQRKCSVTRTFQLKNSTEMPLSFRLSTQPPFSVLQPRGCAGTADCSSPSHSLPPGDNQLLLLQPRHNKQVKVAFHSSLSMLAYLRQSAEEVPPNVSLVTNESGERKLRFRQTLSVHYNNNSLQTVPLCAHLSLPTVSLSCDSLDFGTCYVGQTLVKEVHLSNRGSSSSYWRVIIDSGEEEEGSEFRVTPDCGVLKPLEYPVSSCTQPLQISFTASKEREFQATAVVKGFLGEPPLSLHIQGRGSFDQRFVSLLTDI